MSRPPPPPPARCLGRLRPRARVWGGYIGSLGVSVRTDVWECDAFTLSPLSRTAPPGEAGGRRVALTLPWNGAPVRGAAGEAVPRRRPAASTLHLSTPLHTPLHTPLCSTSRRQRGGRSGGRRTSAHLRAPRLLLSHRRLLLRYILTSTSPIPSLLLPTPLACAHGPAPRPSGITRRLFVVG